MKFKCEVEVRPVGSSLEITFDRWDGDRHSGAVRTIESCIVRDPGDVERIKLAVRRFTGRPVK